MNEKLPSSSCMWNSVSPQVSPTMRVVGESGREAIKLISEIEKFV